jgi:hypothetical protein
MVGFLLWYVHDYYIFTLSAGYLSTVHGCSLIDLCAYLLGEDRP